MVRQTPACAVGDHSGGDVDVIIAGYVGGVYVGLVPGRYDQIAYLDLTH